MALPTPALMKKMAAQAAAKYAKSKVTPKKPSVGAAKGAALGGSVGSKTAPPAKPVKAYPSRMAGQPKSSPKPKASSPTYSGGGGGGGVSGSMGSTAMATSSAPAAEKKPKQLTKKEWEAQDSAFKAEQSSIDAELKSMLAQITNQRAQYGADMGMTFRNLGLERGKQDDWSDASWNREDLLGAYGQAMNNQVNDFAARGLLDSGLYLQNQDDLSRGFDRQRGDLIDNYRSTQSDFDRQRTSAQTSSSVALERARAEAAMRRAAAYGLTGV